MEGCTQLLVNVSILYSELECVIPTAAEYSIIIVNIDHVKYYNTSQCSMLQYTGGMKILQAAVYTQKMIK